jgi:uncharacterized damage-inducible protein DinB
LKKGDDLFMHTKLIYHQWANMRLLIHINEDTFIKEVKSIFPSVAAVFEHIYSVDLIWAKRILGEEQPSMEQISFANPSAAIQSFDKLTGLYKQVSEKEETVFYKNSKGDVFQNELNEVIEHLANHGTYHRGNVSAILHQLGEKSISTDFIFFLREQ